MDDIGVVVTKAIYINLDYLVASVVTHKLLSTAHTTRGYGISRRFFVGAREARFIHRKVKKGFIRGRLYGNFLTPVSAGTSGHKPLKHE
jgi:hypothetical protein